MKIMNGEFKKVVNQMKNAQGKINALIKNQDWVDDARKYADHQRAEVKKLISDDVMKLKNFLENERKEMDRFQRQIPGEIKKFRVFLKGQRTEFQKLIAQIKKTTATKKKGVAKSAGKKTLARKPAKKVIAARKKPTVRKVATASLPQAQPTA